MENQEIQKKHFNCFSAIIITQCVCVAIILFTLIATKLFFKNTYEQVKLLYTENICVNTDVDEVIGEDGEDSAV